MLHNLESWHDAFKCYLFARAEQMLKKVSSLNHSNCQLSRFVMIEYLSLSTLNQLLAFETHLSHQNSMTTSETNKLINSMVSFFVMLKDKNESYDYKSFKSFTTRVWCCKNDFNLLLIYLEEQDLLLRTFDAVIILN